MGPLDGCCVGAASRLLLLSSACCASPDHDRHHRGQESGLAAPGQPPRSAEGANAKLTRRGTPVSPAACTPWPIRARNRATSQLSHTIFATMQGPWLESATDLGCE